MEFGHPYAVLRPVRSGNAFEETIEHLLQAIKVGLFPRGEKLPPERELAAHLGVSRATLRDALAELQRAGFIDVRRGRYGGTYILGSPAAPAESGEPLNPELCQDALIFRSVVEPGAAELAAKSSLSAPARQHLQACLADVLEADETTYRTRDARFHIAVAELSDCPSLVAAVTDARARVSALLDQIPLLGTNLTHSNQQHVALTESILQGDSRRARILMADHLEGTASLLRGFMP